MPSCYKGIQILKKGKGNEARERKGEGGRKGGTEKLGYAGEESEKEKFPE